MTVSAEQRAALARAVSGLRRIFEADYAALAEGKFGIHLAGRRAGEIEDAAALSLSAHDLAARDELVGVIEYLLGEGLGASEAVERMVREAVFTTVNRLLAIRVAEAIGVLPPSLVDGMRSEGFSEAVESFPLLRDADDSGGYWTYLQICGDELSHAVPRLFDRRHPLSALVPSVDGLDEALAILSDPALAAVWVEPEALGWSYQFFNSQDERREMRDASPSPRNSRELAVRNQFFTPSYVVDYLVQNTLGKRLLESGLGLDLPLLMGELDTESPPVKLEEVSILDPAVGSGHFLLGAYDLLERAWIERGLSAEDAAPRILDSLYGIDIDARAAQVAQAVIYLRARRSSPGTPLRPPVIVTSRPLPRDPAVLGAVLAGQSKLVHDLVNEVASELEMAPELGSLLKIEEVVRAGLEDRMAIPQLGDDLSDGFERIEATVLAAVEGIARSSESTPEERLFAADTSDALRFVELSMRRYDVVLMNPPFGKPVPATKPYLRANYARQATDLYSGFVNRGLGWLRVGGALGAITSRTGFFHPTLADWRAETLLPHLSDVVDLGHGVLEDALVEVAAYTLRARRGHRAIHVLQLLKTREKGKNLRQGIGERYVAPSRELNAIPGAPLAYWVSSDIRELYQRFPPLEANGAAFRQGLASADDFRFFRLWWEVRSSDVGRDRRWLPLSKGGPYSPYYRDLTLVVDWEDDGRRMRDFERAVVRNSDLYLTPGLTWSYATTSALSVRAMPAEAVFANGGNIAVAQGMSLQELGAILTSRPVRQVMAPLLSAGEQSASGTPRNMYQVGVLQRIPRPPTNGDIGDHWLELVRLQQRRGRSDETDHLFLHPHAGWPDPEARFASAIDLAQRIDDSVGAAYGLGPEVLAEIDADQGPNPASYPDIEPDGLLEEFAELYTAPMGQLVDRVLAHLGGARYLAVKSYFLDRRLELLSHYFRIHPRAVVRLRDRLGLVDPEQAKRTGADYVSHLVGCAFGRWDVRLSSASDGEELPSPFDPLPSTSPGMLTDDFGSPVIDTPDGYPMGLPPDRVLVDEAGHDLDIVARVELAASIVSSDSEERLQSAVRSSGMSSLRELLRRAFSVEHLDRYSAFRRKAPIYWYFAVPSGEWGVWLYALSLSREQLYAVERLSQDKLRRLSELVGQMRRELDAGEAREIRSRIENAQGLLREVGDFHATIEAVAQSGWTPDLNDGIVLNAAPLGALIAESKWRNEVIKHRNKMEHGAYPWATVQRDYFNRLKT